MTKDMTFRLKIVTLVGLVYTLSFCTLYNLDNLWENGDSSGYYIHLVSLFIYGDIGSYDKSTEAMIDNNPSTGKLLEDPFWIKETEIGKKSIKYTIGVALMEVPGFFLAHVYSMIDPNFKPDGWSQPYIVGINILKVVYIIIGFYFLIPILENNFSKSTTAFTVLGIAFGTNLFFHVPSLTMAHPFLFFDFCMLIYFTSKFYDKQSYIRASMIGLFLGLITVTRIPEAIAVLIPVFWGIYDRKSLRKRFKLLNSNYPFILTTVFFSGMIIFVQVAYWYYVSGQILFNPYQGEGFDFTKPDFIRGFFSLNNGWLIYTPLMLFSLLGLFYLRKKNKDVVLPIILFVGLHTWIHFSYYTVNYFPGLGSRPMIETYPLLAFGLASFISYCERNQILRLFSLLVLVLCIALNVFQTIQSKEGILLSEKMNRTYYWEIFGRLEIDLNAVKEYDSNENQPEEHAVVFRNNIFFEDFEDSTSIHYNNENVYSGKFSYLVSNEFPDIKFEGRLKRLELKEGEYISASIYAYRYIDDFVSSQYELENLVVEFIDEVGKTRRWRGISISRYIQNNNSIFHTGKANTWGQAQFYVQVPSGATDEWLLRVSIRNLSNKKLYLDDLRIDRYTSLK